MRTQSIPFRLAFIAALTTGLGTTAMGQVKIGDNPQTVNASAVLELESTNKALLLPRVALNSTTNSAANPITSPAAGMVVYNTNAAIGNTSVTPATYPARGAGVYYFDGTGWVRSDGMAVGNGLTATGGTISLGGTLTSDVNFATGNSSVNISGASIGEAAGDEVLSVTNTPTGALLPGTFAFASENMMNYNGGGTGKISLPQAVGGIRARTISNSQNFQAQGANFEARATGGSSGDFQAIGAVAVGTSTTQTVGDSSTLIGLQAGAGYLGSPTAVNTWDVIGVDAYTNYGSVTSGITAGGNFDGAGGTTSFGVIGTIDDNPYTTFGSSDLTGKRIGVVAANRVGSLPGGLPGNTDFALYGIGEVRFTEGDVVVGNVGAAPSFNDVASAALQVNSTTQGFLPPRMTAAQASAISSPAEGLMIYVTNTNGTFAAKGWYGWNGATWEKLNN